MFCGKNAKLNKRRQQWQILDAKKKIATVKLLRELPMRLE
jgi:hypothetical protein